MRVLLLHKFLFQKGGAEVFLFETARALEQAGHEVAFLATRNENNVDTPWNKYFPAAPMFDSRNPLARARSLPKVIYSREARTATRRVIAAFQPDIAHSFHVFTHLSPSVLDACSEAGMPVVMSCNDYKHICPNYQLYHHGHLCQRCIRQNFSYAILTKCCKSSLAYSAASCLESTVHELGNLVRRNVKLFLFSSDFMGLTTERFWGQGSFSWRKLRNPFDSTAHTAVFPVGSKALFIGRFVGEKGADVLIRAAARCPEIPVVMVGEGPDEDALRTLARQLGARNVSFVGPKWEQDLRDMLSDARFVIVPSMWHENYPYVVIQAFALGRPVIGSTRGGIPELVRPGSTGLLFNPEKPTELAAHMSRLWADPVSCTNMGRTAKALADSFFTPKAFQNELLDAYDEVLR